MIAPELLPKRMKNSQNYYSLKQQRSRYPGSMYQLRNKPDSLSLLPGERRSAVSCHNLHFPWVASQFRQWANIEKSHWKEREVSMPEVTPRFFLCRTGPWPCAVAPEACLKLSKARRNVCKLLNTHYLVSSGWRALMVSKFTNVLSESSLQWALIIPRDSGFCRYKVEHNSFIQQIMTEHSLCAKFWV